MVASLGFWVIENLFPGFQAQAIPVSWQEIIRPLGLAVYILTILGLALNYFVTRKIRPAEREIQAADREVARYRKPTRLLHWCQAASFVVLFVSGMVFFFSASTVTSSSWLHIVHRAAGVIFIALPLLYLLVRWRTAWRGIKLAFQWGVADLEWAKAAPQYYYLFEEEAMPPQGYLNTGQKAWWLMVIVLGPVLAVTGVLLWVFQADAARQYYQLLLFYHEVSFIIIGNMFLVHIYLALIHPHARPWRSGPWHAMTRGKVALEYARRHHGKWLQDLQKTEKPPEK